jgi:hypothetical protein
VTDESFVNEAVSLTYDQAECNRYRVGIWTQDQWEAFSVNHAVGHAYPVDVDYFQAFPNVARFVVELGDKCTSMGRPLRGEFARRHDMAAASLAVAP